MTEKTERETPANEAPPGQYTGSSHTFSAPTGMPVLRGDPTSYMAYRPTRMSEEYPRVAAQRRSETLGAQLDVRRRFPEQFRAAAGEAADWRASMRAECVSLAGLATRRLRRDFAPSIPTIRASVAVLVAAASELLTSLVNECLAADEPPAAAHAETDAAAVAAAVADLVYAGNSMLFSPSTGALVGIRSSEFIAGTARLLARVLRFAAMQAAKPNLIQFLEFDECLRRIDLFAEEILGVAHAVRELFTPSEASRTSPAAARQTALQGAAIAAISAVDSIAFTARICDQDAVVAWVVSETIDNAAEFDIPDEFGVLALRRIAEFADSALSGLVDEDLHDRLSKRIVATQKHLIAVHGDVRLAARGSRLAGGNVQAKAHHWLLDPLDVLPSNTPATKPLILQVWSAHLDLLLAQLWPRPGFTARGEPLHAVVRGLLRQTQPAVFVFTPIAKPAAHHVGQLVREMKQLAALHHECLLEVMGAYLTSSHRVLVLGSFDYTLSDPADVRVMPRELRMSMVRDIARGLLALHEHSPPIAHGCLVPENIVVVSDPLPRALVAGFGVASLMGDIRGQMDYLFQWTAPELLVTQTDDATGSPILTAAPGTVQSDMFSLGLLMYYMLSCTPPFPNETPARLQATFAAGIGPLRPPSNRAARLEGQDEIFDPAWDLIVECLAADPSRRISCRAALAHMDLLPDNAFSREAPLFTPAVRVADGEGGSAVPALDAPFSKRDIGGAGQRARPAAFKTGVPTAAAATAASATAATAVDEASQWAAAIDQHGEDLSDGDEVFFDAASFNSSPRKPGSGLGEPNGADAKCLSHAFPAWATASGFKGASAGTYQATRLEYYDSDSEAYMDKETVEFNESGRIVGLRLKGNALRCKLPAKMFSLTELTELCLSSNCLTGPIPTEISRLVKLRKLLLGSNKLDGELIPHIFHLAHLEELDVSHNKLKGYIPQEIANSVKLRKLLLSHNAFSGSVPSWLASLTQLRRLWLNNNQFTGQIPSGIGKLVELRELWVDAMICCQFVLDPEIPGADMFDAWTDGCLMARRNMSENQLSGEIPETLWSLVKLQSLNLSQNLLSGGIHKDIGRLKHLQLLYLSSNGLTGPIPVDIKKLVNIQEMDLSHNQLYGLIPSEIGRLSELRVLDLRYNQLVGPIPAMIGNLTKLV
nr:hypothetical protein HK105_000349 [Polyrhizophydium stewartii]